METESKAKKGNIQSVEIKMLMDKSCLWKDWNEDYSLIKGLGRELSTDHRIVTRAFYSSKNWDENYPLIKEIGGELSTDQAATFSIGYFRKDKTLVNS